MCPCVFARTQAGDRITAIPIVNGISQLGGGHGAWQGGGGGGAQPGRGKGGGSCPQGGHGVWHGDDGGSRGDQAGGGAPHNSLAAPASNVMWHPRSPKDGQPGLANKAALKVQVMHILQPAYEAGQISKDDFKKVASAATTTALQMAITGHLARCASQETGLVLVAQRSTSRCRCSTRSTCSS